MHKAETPETPQRSGPSLLVGIVLLTLWAGLLTARLYNRPLDTPQAVNPTSQQETQDQEGETTIAATSSEPTDVAAASSESTVVSDGEEVYVAPAASASPTRAVSYASLAAPPPAQQPVPSPQPAPQSVAIPQEPVPQPQPAPPPASQQSQPSLKGRYQRPGASGSSRSSPLSSAVTALCSLRLCL